MIKSGPNKKKLLLAKSSNPEFNTNGTFGHCVVTSALKSADE